MTPAQTSNIEAIVTLFDAAERKIKAVELLTNNLSIPAINELRYVGYHLARACSEEDEQEANSHLEKAKGHCKRAIYDAHEIGILYMLKHIDTFKQEYTSHAAFVLGAIPSYTEKLAQSSKAVQFISEMRKKHRDSRDDYYLECAPHYETLQDFVGLLTESEPLISAHITKQIEQDQKDTRRFIIRTCLTLLSIVLVIMGGLFFS